uniref:Uncharacterized protein n=1 Tax=Anguilla anguilla TaxID=7936 RepID=A0A0E9TRS9_ANGAN
MLMRVLAVGNDLQEDNNFDWG